MIVPPSLNQQFMAHGGVGRVCLFGAAPDTGNLGVSALCHATVQTLLRLEPKLHLTIFDYGRGLRRSTTLGGPALPCSLCGGFQTRRWHRRESLWNIRLSARLGGLGNPAARALLSADAVLDISGGDSFTDLYGARRFWDVAKPKLLALDMGKPLILLPQTYGPFRSARLRRVAEQIVQRATMAWARDADSFAVLHALAAGRFDDGRHRCGVDMAFGLEPRQPSVALPAELANWLDSRDVPVVGINISGLIYNGGADAKRQYALRADYAAVVDAMLDRLLKETDAHIVLVPHVLASSGQVESDADACAAALDRLGAGSRKRVAVLPLSYDQSEIKWVIARTAWFWGTRMHSTIAALSSGVPTAASAYSVKTEGVFRACGQDSHVADLRTQATAQVVQSLWRSWSQREDARRSLAEHLQAVQRQLDDQGSRILTACLARLGHSNSISSLPELSRT